MPNILVTGGAGYIGSHVCKALSMQGFTPITLDNLSRGHRKNIKWGPFIDGSIHDFDMVLKTLIDFEIKAVMHFAAYAYVFESVTNPNIYFENNFYGSLLLVEAMKKAQVKKLIFSSTCAIFGESKEKTINEDHQKNPINPYGLSKLLVEKMLTKHKTLNDIEFCALRYFNAAGADPEGELKECHSPEPHIIPNIIRAANENAPLFINGNDYSTPDGTCVRDYIHVTDLADAHVLALKKMLVHETKSSFYNLGNSKGFSLLDLITTTENVLGKKINFELKERRPGDPAYLVGSADRFIKEFNWIPKHSDINTIIKTASQK